MKGRGTNLGEDFSECSDGFHVLALVQQPFALVDFALHLRD